MPQKKNTPEFGKLRQLLLSYEINAPRLAPLMGCGESTARKRLKSPGDFTLRELENVSRRGHIPMDEIRAAIVR